MGTLSTTPERALSLYPRRHAPHTLAVAMPEHTADTLRLRYLERNAPDPYRNFASWEAYRRRCAELRAKMPPQQGKIILYPHPDPPEDFAHIYQKNEPYLGSEIAAADRLLLHADLTRHSDDAAYLQWIERHPALRGTPVVREFYGAMLDFLREQGFRFLMAQPAAEKLAPYWEQMGQVRCTRIRPDTLPRIGIPPHYRNT